MDVSIESDDEASANAVKTTLDTIGTAALAEGIVEDVSASGEPILEGLDRPVATVSEAAVQAPTPTPAPTSPPAPTVTSAPGATPTPDDDEDSAAGAVVSTAMLALYGVVAILM